MKNSYQVFPNPSQALLLKILLGKESDMKAVGQWRTLVGAQENWDSATLRFIPLLYSRLQSWGIPARELLFLKNLNQAHWMLSQKSVIQAKEIISFLSIHEISSLVAKGLPLALDYYEKPFYRPIGDIDIFINRADVKKAYEVLLNNGWVCVENGGGKESLTVLMAKLNALTFIHALFGELDLHWKLFHDCAQIDTNKQLWNRAVNFSWEGEHCLRLSNEDMLVHIVLHGMRASEESSIRWIVDALVVIQKDGSSMDWNYIIAFAKAHKVTLRILMALEYLRAEYGLGAPTWVLSALKEVNVDVFELWESRVLLADPKLFSAGIGRFKWRCLHLWRLWRRYDKQDMIIVVLGKTLPAPLFKKVESKLF